MDADVMMKYNRNCIKMRKENMKNKKSNYTFRSQSNFLSHILCHSYVKMQERMEVSYYFTSNNRKNNFPIELSFFMFFIILHFSIIIRVSSSSISSVYLFNNSHQINLTILSLIDCYIFWCYIYSFNFFCLI